MVDAIPWPTRVLPFQSIMFRRETMSRSGGQSISGAEQVVVSSADRWKARATLKIHRPEQKLAFRGMMAAADGRVGTWLIPPCSGFYRLGSPVRGIFPAVGVPTISNVPFGDGSTFSDTGALETKLIMGSVVSPAAVRSRTIVVQMEGIGEFSSADFSSADFNTTDVIPTPLAGQFFSIGQHLYVIATSEPVNDDSSSGAFTLTIRPGLRAAAVAGDVVDFSRPACLMRLASDDSGEMDLDMLRFAPVSLDFVEDPLTA